MSKIKKSKDDDGTIDADTSAFTMFDAATYEWDRPLKDKILALWVQDPTFLSKHRRFCKSVFFAEEDLYLVADQILKHWDKEALPPDETMLVQRLRMYDAQSKRKLDIVSAVKLAREIYKISVIGSKATITEWMIHFGKVEHTKVAVHRTVEFMRQGKYDDIQELMTQLFDFYRTSEFEDVDDAFIEDSIIADMANRRIRQHQRIPTGIQAIDNYLGGGLGLGQLYLIAAGTGVGKTTAALTFCRGAVHTKEPTLLISTELGRHRLVDKYHAAVTGIPVGLPQLEKEHLLYRRMKQYLETRQRVFRLAWWEPYTATVADLKRYVQHIQDHYNFFPKLIVIDSPDLLRPENKKNQKPHESLAEIWTALFAMTNRENVAMVLTTDVKQACRDQLLIGATSIGGSYEKPKKADGIFGLGKDKVKGQLDANGCFTIWVNIDKLRTDGTSGMVLETKVDPKRARWISTEVVPPERLKEADGKQKGSSSNYTENEYRK